MKALIIKMVSAFLALAAGCVDQRETVSIIDPAAVLKECDVAHIANPWVAAWDDDRSVTAVVGTRGTSHVLILAHRNPKSSIPHLRQWQVAETSIMMVNHDEHWVIGEREFSHVPTRANILDVCRELWWTEPGTVFDHWSPRVERGMTHATDAASAP